MPITYRKRSDFESNVFSTLIALLMAGIFLFIMYDHFFYVEESSEQHEPAYNSDVFDSLIAVIKELQANQIKISVKATAYSSEAAQTDNTPSITAFNTQVVVGGCAISRDLEKAMKLKPGDILITNIGNFMFNDRTHKRKTYQIDIYKKLKQEAIEFGVQQILIVGIEKDMID